MTISEGMEVEQASDGTLIYGGGVVTVFPPGTPVDLGDGESEVIAQAIELTDTMYPRRVKCSPDGDRTCCAGCSASGCQPPTLGPPMAPLADARMQPTPMVFANGVTFSPDVITTPAGPIFVFGTELPVTIDTVIELLKELLDEQSSSSRLVFHVYTISAIPSGLFPDKLVAIPVSLEWTNDGPCPPV